MIKRDATLHWYISNYYPDKPAALVLSLDNDWRFDVMGWFPGLSRREHVGRVVDGADNATDREPGSLRRWLVELEAQYVHAR